MKVNTSSAFFLIIYILLIGIQEPFRLSIIEGKIQFADLWFLIMITYFLLNRKYLTLQFNELIQHKTIHSFFILSILYLCTNAFSIFKSYSFSGLIELIGKCYLFSMSMMVLTLLFLMEKEKSVKIIFTGFNILGISLATIGIIGWILSICGIHNEATQIYLDYPYFGDAHRLKAFTTTPSMYISIITLCIVLSLCNYLFYEKTKLHLFASVFFTITALLTLTKSFLYIVAAWIVLILFKYYKNEVAIIFTFLGFLILQVVLTHFLIIPNEKSNSEKFQSSPYTSNEIIYRGQDFSIIGSGYYTFKKTAWKLFNEFSLSGVGPGNYNRQVARLKAEGFYPANLANYDPHSAYLGALAETGIAGFIAMMLLGLFITGLFVKMEVKSDPFSFSLFLLFLIMIAEGVSMDTMNFRHYWVIIALILFQYLNINSNK